MTGKVLLFATCLYIVFIATLAVDHNPDEDHSDHRGCRKDSDCGPDGSTCRSNGECSCPGVPRKDYIVIPNAKPQCQKVASLGVACNYNEQCHVSAGLLSRCHPKNKKCECYDTEKGGSDVVWPYSGTCYYATALGENCDSDNQCAAFIEPESHVKCFHNETVGRQHCRCIEGQNDCKEKSGAAVAVLGISSLATFAFVGLMATQVFM